MEEKEKLTLTPCPSLRELQVDDDDGAVHHEPPPQIPAVHRPGEVEEPPQIPAVHRPGDGDNSSDNDSEFSFVLRPGFTSDEIFSDGRIRPVYPVFGRHLLSADEAAPQPPPPQEAATPRRSPLRKLLIEERNASSGTASSPSPSPSSAGDGLEGIPPETYCVWAPGSAAPSPARCRKSGSTGSLMRWRMLSDLVVGRSHSDGREKFVFLAAEEKKKKTPTTTTTPIPNPNPNPSREKKGKEEEEEEGRAKGKGKSKGGKVTEVDAVTAHRVYYGKGSNSGGRRSFLPYKQDLVGFFANANGVSRTYHPF